MSTAFIPKFETAKTLSATSTTGSTTLAPECPQVRIKNAGPNDAFVVWGKGTQTALATHMAIGAGTIECFTKQDAETIAAICASGQTATLQIICGTGD